MIVILGLFFLLTDWLLFREGEASFGIGRQGQGDGRVLDVDGKGVGLLETWTIS